MQRLIIVGAGGFGREVTEWARQHPDCGREWEIAGYLDDRPDVLDGYSMGGLRVIGSIRDYQQEEDEVLLCGLGDPLIRRQVVGDLEGKGGRFLTMVHPTAVIGRNVSIGYGSVICPYVTLTCDIQIGRFAVLNIGASVGHDVYMGDWCTLSGHCDVTGFAKLGDCVFMGTHAAVMPEVKIGNEVKLGAGVMAYTHVPDGATLAQMPARRIS